MILETSLDKAIEHWNNEIAELIVLDIELTNQNRVELYKTFRANCVNPILLLLPVYHETQILEAYAAGVDDVVVKPISPPIFLAKIMAWLRRGWMVSVEDLDLVNAGRYRLDPSGRCLLDANEMEIKLTNLEFRLLHLLMSRPRHVFSTDDIVQFIWGKYGNGDQVLLKNVVYRLRKKIEEDPSHPTLLQTEEGGYSFRW